tara:strand:+ start:1307 stop:1744 length:438 start_codon:yes stop_codon:yes gene_type:complete
MNRLINAFVIFQFVKLLATPYKKTEAFKLGIIDEKGKYLKKQRDLKTTAEKKASNIFTRLVWNIKKLIEKVPFGKTRLASIATALYLIKEETEKVGVDGEMLEEAFCSWLMEEHGIDYKTELLNEKFEELNLINNLKENKHGKLS